MFFILPVGVDYQARRYPVMTFTFIGINTLVYLIAWLALLTGGPEGEGEERLVMTLGLIPAHLTVHGWLTTLFTQVDFFHLLGNMIYLFLFGACVEDLLGRWQFVVFYLFGGLASDLIHIAAALGGPAAGQPLIGASGAISACIGGFVLLLSKTKIHFRYFVWAFLRAWSGEFWLPAWLVISFWFFLDLLNAIMSLAGGGAGGGVAFAAHVGGFLGGLAMITIYKALRGQAGSRVATPLLPLGAGPVHPIAVQQPTIYLSDNGVQLGPFTAGQVKDMLRLGSVTPGAWYWREGMPEWRPAAELG